MQTVQTDSDSPGRYDQAVEYLFRHTDYERMARVRQHTGAYDLDRMRNLCERIGRPQDSFPSVHIAGTKGKGSVATMTAYLLAGGGLRTGLYTSPHLVDLRERITVLRSASGDSRTVRTRPIDCAPISPDQFADALEAILSRTGEAGEERDRPTFFELVTAMAFVHFAGLPVDIASLEVGLGGRLDATNVVVPRVCAITSIGIDHTRQLGNTIEQIAAEKAGIIKPGVPVVSAPQRPSVEQVIRRAAAKRLAPVFFVGQEVSLGRRLIDPPGSPDPRRWEVTVSTPGRTFGPLVVPLLGRHQAVNLAVALGVLDRLLDAGFQVDLEGAWAGLAQTRWPGRLDIRRRKPWLVLDGAHTVEAMRAVLATLPETFTYDRLIVVAGCLADKDPPGLMGQLANGPHTVVLTRSDHPHAADPELLAHLLSVRAPLVRQQVEPDPAAAVELALRQAAPNDMVLVTGSIYLVGLVLKVGPAAGWFQRDWAEPAEGTRQPG